MALTVDPPMCQLPAAGGESIHQLTNASEARLAFKIKSTDNDHYRVQPVYGFVEIGGSTPISITRLEGPPKEDKFVILFCEVPAEEADPMAPFKAGAPTGEVIVLAKCE